MAQNHSEFKHPRIRKALTMREQAEMARVQAKAGITPSKLTRFSTRLPKIGYIFRPLKKVLSWLLPRYFINSWREVKQVTWPSRSETWRLAGAVIIFAIVFGALIAGVDKILDAIFKNVILK